MDRRVLCIVKGLELGGVATESQRLKKNRINRETVDLDMIPCDFCRELRKITTETPWNACKIVKPAARRSIGCISGAGRERISRETGDMK